MIPILYLYFIKTKKETVINFCKKYFHHYDTYTLLIFHQNQRRTSNKFAPEIFSLLWHQYLHFIKTKNEEAINLHQKYFHYYHPYTLLIFHQNQKENSNKFAQEIFSPLWYLYFTYISSELKKNKQKICKRNIFIPTIPMLHYKQK